MARSRNDIETSTTAPGLLMLEVLLDIREQNAALLARPAAVPASAPRPPGGGPVFPPFGKNKGEPIAGATMQNLKYYEGACLRTLNDPAKSRWHDKERALLTALHEEIARQGGVPDDGGFGPPSAGMGGGAVPDNPGPEQDDIPFAFIETRLDQP